MIRTQIQLTEAQARRLRRAAAGAGVSVAEMIRRCVEAALPEEETPAAGYRRAAAVVGRFRERGPADAARRHDDHLDAAFE
jgi:hypothetical protein